MKKFWIEYQNKDEVLKIHNSIKELEKIIALIRNNQDIYDFEAVNNLIAKFKQEVGLCVKIDENFLIFFNDKKNFRIIADLRNFSNFKLKYSLKKTKRVEIEEELAKFAISKNLTTEELKGFLGKSEITKITTIQPKKKTTPKPKTPKIKDQTYRWLNLTIEQLKKELNDLNTYPDAKALRMAAISVLRANEKRFRKREKIINAIIERISDERAIAHLGR